MSKHTPGPWFLVISPKAWMNKFQIERSDGACLFSFGESPFHDDAEADARLIVAAPEMLEMLTQCRKEFAGLPHSLGYDFTHLPKLDALIAKATGAA